MKTDTSEARLTSGEVSRLAGIPLQTLIRWDRSGVLKAKRPGRRSSSQAPRRYDENALVAALFSRSVSRMGFTGNRLAEMVRLMQTADRKTLRRWVLYSYRNSPGLISHDFGEYPQEVGRHVEWLRERGVLIDGPTDLWTVRENLLGSARSLIEKRGEVSGVDGVREED